MIVKEIRRCVEDFGVRQTLLMFVGIGFAIGLGIIGAFRTFS